MLSGMCCTVNFDVICRFLRFESASWLDAHLVVLSYFSLQRDYLCTHPTLQAWGKATYSSKMFRLLWQQTEIITSSIIPCFPHGSFCRESATFVTLSTLKYWIITYILIYTYIITYIYFSLSSLSHNQSVYLAVSKRKQLWLIYTESEFIKRIQDDSQKYQDVWRTWPNIIPQVPPRTTKDFAATDPKCQMLPLHH